MVRGFRSSLGGPNYARCRCVKINSMFDFLSVWKTRRRYVKSGRLLADHILQHIGSERSDSIREMHFWTFFCRRAKTLKWQPKVNRKTIDVRVFERLENSEKVREFSWRTTFCNILAASARILFVKLLYLMEKINRAFPCAGRFAWHCAKVLRESLAWGSCVNLLWRSIRIGRGVGVGSGWDLGEIVVLRGSLA